MIKASRPELILFATAVVSLAFSVGACGSSIGKKALVATEVASYGAELHACLDSAKAVDSGKFDSKGFEGCLAHVDEKFGAVK